MPMWENTFSKRYDTFLDQNKLTLQVIGPTGLLRNKTRILVTHGLSYTKLADEIIVLEGIDLILFFLN